MFIEFIYMYKALWQSFNPSVSLSSFCLSPGGQTFLTQRREGGQTFFSHSGVDKLFYIKGGTNIFTSMGGEFFFQKGGANILCYDDVDEEMNVSKAKAK